VELHLDNDSNNDKMDHSDDHKDDDDSYNDDDNDNDNDNNDDDNKYKSFNIFETNLLSILFAIIPHTTDQLAQGLKVSF
jgi:hypothetical protein